MEVLGNVPEVVFEVGGVVYLLSKLLAVMPQTTTATMPEYLQTIFETKMQR